MSLIVTKNLYSFVANGCKFEVQKDGQRIELKTNKGNIVKTVL